MTSPGIDIITAAKSVLDRLKLDAPDAYGLVDDQWALPAVYRGEGPIRLIVLGQDPTVNRKEVQPTVTTVLKLNNHGPLRSYIKGLCNTLGVNFDTELYATNLFKNVFTEPPVQLEKTAPDVFKRFTEVWLPLLRDELKQFPDVPVITLGEPLLRVLALPDTLSRVRDYWGYLPQWKEGAQGTFASLPASQNRLGRTLFPFPHTTSARAKRFYSDRIADYLRFIAKETGLKATLSGNSNE